VDFASKEPEGLRPDRFALNWQAVADTFSFRARQDECLAAIASNQCGVIDAPTGFGKGVLLGMAAALFAKAQVHVVTARRDVVDKTVGFLSQHFPNVGQVGGGRKRLGDRVTVFTADSLHLSDGAADILFVDEAHELLTPTRSKELAKYAHSRNYAFTATPEGRGDKADPKLESIFGPKIFEMTYAEAAALGLVTHIVVEWLDVKLDYNPAAGKADVHKKRHGLWRNAERNQAIADKARSYGPETQVLILTETVEHAMYLKALLPEFELCYAQVDKNDFARYQRQGLIGLYDEPVSPRRREELRREFEEGKLRKCIATDVWSTGVDFVGLQVLVRADARASDIMDSQAPGRVCRCDAGKAHGVVVDLLDQFDRGLHSKALKRKRNYESKGWRQVMPPRNGRAHGGKAAEAEGA